MRGKLYASKVVRKTLLAADEEVSANKKIFEKAEKNFVEAMQVAEESQSRRSLAKLRIGLVKL